VLVNKPEVCLIYRAALQKALHSFLAAVPSLLLHISPSIHLRTACRVGGGPSAVAVAAAAAAAASPAGKPHGSSPSHPLHHEIRIDRVAKPDDKPVREKCEPCGRCPTHM